MAATTTEKGRPAQFKVRVPLMIYAELETRETLKAIARRDGTSVQEIVRDLIAEYVKAHKDDNTQFRLDPFQNPAFVAFPTLGEPPRSPKTLHEQYNAQDLKTLQRSVKVWGKSIEYALEAKKGKVRFD